MASDEGQPYGYAVLHEIVDEKGSFAQLIGWFVPDDAGDGMSAREQARSLLSHQQAMQPVHDVPGEYCLVEIRKL